MIRDVRSRLKYRHKNASPLASVCRICDGEPPFLALDELLILIKV